MGVREIVRGMGYATIAIHISLAIIAVGGCVSHFFAEQGTMVLREGERTDAAMTEEGERMEVPFGVTLERFEIKYYVGTDTPRDYASDIVIDDGEERMERRVSMNKVVDERGYRMFQTSYDMVERVSVLTITHDPVGTGITYTGYAMLLVSFAWFLFSKNSDFRRTLRAKRWAAVCGAMALFGGNGARAEEVFAPRCLTAEDAEAFGRLHVLYNGRVTTVETYALDFCRKICGRDGFKGYGAAQVLSGWIFAPEDWERVRMIKTEEGMKSLGEAIGSKPKSKKERDRIDERLWLIVSLKRGEGLNIIPKREGDGKTVWLTPEEAGASDNDTIRKALSIFPIIYTEMRERGSAREAVGLLDKYQRRQAGEAIDEARDEIEHYYNKYCHYAGILPYIALTLGIIAFGILVARRQGTVVRRVMHASLYAVFALLSIMLGLRWIVSGHAPLTNGYETMMVIAWCASGIGAVGSGRVRMALPFGLLVSGFALLVSKMNMMDPNITPMMPVLASPWLSAHVSLMMVSYTLFAFIFLNSAVSLVMYARRRRRDEIEGYADLNAVVLCPAVMMLTAGMFIGAVWANESWGTYWSWDPKETWALITMLCYAVALHRRRIRWLRDAVAYQVYVGACILAVLMTYFGVNYFMGGMHSYA